MTTKTSKYHLDVSQLSDQCFRDFLLSLLYDSNSLRRKKRPLIGLGQCAWALNRYRSETLKSPGHFLRLTTISIFKLNYFQYFLKFYLLENEWIILKQHQFSQLV